MGINDDEDEDDGENDETGDIAKKKWGKWFAISRIAFNQFHSFKVYLKLLVLAKNNCIGSKLNWFSFLGTTLLAKSI